MLKGNTLRRTTWPPGPHTSCHPGSKSSQAELSGIHPMSTAACLALLILPLRLLLLHYC